MPPTTPPGNPPEETQTFVVESDPTLTEQGLAPPTRKSQAKATTSKGADKKQADTELGTFNIPKLSGQPQSKVIGGQSPLARSAQSSSHPREEGIQVRPRSHKTQRTEQAPYKQRGGPREFHSSQGSSRHGSTSTADSVFVRGGGNRGGRPFPQYRGNKPQRGSGTRGQSTGAAERGWGFPDPKTGEQPGPRGSGRGNRPRGNHRPRGGRGGNYRRPECFYCKGTDHDERDCPKNEFRNQQERRADQRRREEEFAQGSPTRPHTPQPVEGETYQADEEFSPPAGHEVTQEFDNPEFRDYQPADQGWATESQEMPADDYPARPVEKSLNVAAASRMIQQSIGTSSTAPTGGQIQQGQQMPGTSQALQTLQPRRTESSASQQATRPLFHYDPQKKRFDPVEPIPSLRSSLQPQKSQPTYPQYGQIGYGFGPMQGAYFMPPMNQYGQPFGPYGMGYGSQFGMQGYGMPCYPPPPGGFAHPSAPRQNYYAEEQEMEYEMENFQAVRQQLQGRIPYVLPPMTSKRQQPRFATSTPVPTQTVQIQQMDTTQPSTFTSPSKSITEGMAELGTESIPGQETPNVRRSMQIDEESQLPTKMLAASLPLGGSEHTSSTLQNITQNVETITEGALPTGKEMRRRQRQQPTTWKVEPVGQTIEDIEYVYTIADADAWSAVGILLHPKIGSKTSPTIPPLMQFGALGIHAAKVKGVLDYNVGDTIYVSSYKNVKPEVDKTPDQTSTEDPKHWIPRDAQFVTSHAVAVKASRREMIKSHRGRANFGEVALIISSRMVNDERSSTKEIQAMRVEATVAAGSIGSAVIMHSRHIEPSNATGYLPFALVKMDTITVFKGATGKYGQNLYVPSDYYHSSIKLRRSQRIIERITGAGQEIREIVRENQNVWAASLPDPKPRGGDPANVAAVAKFAKKWPILRDVTGAVLAVERAVTEMNTSKAKVRVLVTNLLQDHTWKFQIDAEAYNKLHKTVKRIAEEHIFRKNSSVVLMYEEDGKKVKMFEALVRSTTYARSTRVNAKGKREEDVIPSTLIARRQISYFGKVEAKPPVDQPIEQGVIDPRRAPISTFEKIFVRKESAKDVEEEKKEEDASQDESSSDEEEAVHKEEDFYDVNVCTKGNQFHVVEKIDTKKYNTPKDTDVQLNLDMNWPNGGPDDDDELRAKCYLVPSMLFPQLRTRSNAFREWNAIPMGTPNSSPQDSIMYVFDGIEIQPYENRFVQKDGYAESEPWDQEIPAVRQKDDEAYAVTPAQLYADILGVEIPTSADVENWVLNPRSPKTTTTKYKQPSLEDDDWTQQGGFASENDAEEGEVETQEQMDTGTSANNGTENEDEVYVPAMDFTESMETLMQSRWACRKIMYAIYCTLKRAIVMASPCVMMPQTFKELAERQINNVIHLTPRQNRDVFKHDSCRNATDCLTVSEGFADLMDLWAEKHHLTIPGIGENEPPMSLMSKDVDERMLNEDQMQTRGVLKQNRKRYADAFVCAWDSIWSAITQQAIKQNAFSQEDVDVRQHKVNAKNAFTARVRHYLNYYVMRDLKKKHVTELEMDALQAAVLKSARHSIKQREDMQRAITKEYTNINFEHDTTDWLVTEFDNWCIKSKMIDAQGNSLFQLIDTRATNKAHIQASQQLWTRCNLIQNTVKNLILDIEKNVDKEPISVDEVFRTKDDDKLEKFTYQDLVAANYVWNDETKEFDEKSPRDKGRSRPPRQKFDITELLLKQEFASEHAQPMSRDDIRQGIRESFLNDRQKMSLFNILVRELCLGYIIAAPGTGKTLLLGEYVKRLLKRFPGDFILCLSATNLNCVNITEHICRAIEAEEGQVCDQVLLVQSTYAQTADIGAMSTTIYMRPQEEESPAERFKLSRHLAKLVEAHEADQIPKDMGWSRSKADEIKAYIKNKKSDPFCHMPENKVISYALLYGKTRVLVCTQDKALSLRKLLKLFTHAVSDEASQAKHVDMNMMAARMPLKTVFVTRDPEQLEPFRPTVLKGCPDYGYSSIAQHLERYAPDSTRVQLNIAYRSHPQITRCVSKAAYEGKLMPGTTEEERQALVGTLFPLAREKYPIVLIHSPEPHVAGIEGQTTLHNPKHDELAVALVKQLATHVKDLRIVVECYYSGDVREIAAECNKRWRTSPAELSTQLCVEVRTVNAIIGQEADIIIIVTGRTEGLEVAEDFVLQPRLATVAVSRPKHGLFIIGNMDYLTVQEGGVMKRFVEASLEEAPSVDGPKYLKYLEAKPQNWPPVYKESQGGLLSDINNAGQSIVAACDSNREYGWHANELEPGEHIPRVYVQKPIPQATILAAKRRGQRGATQARPGGRERMNWSENRQGSTSSGFQGSGFGDTSGFGGSGFGSGSSTSTFRPRKHQTSKR